MRRLLLILTATALLLPIQSVCGDEDVTPHSVRAGATLAIDGPDEPIDVDDDAYLRLDGLTLSEIQAAKSDSLFDLTVFPLDGVRVHASYDWLNDMLELTFRASNPGDYLVKLHLVRNGKLEIAAATVVVEGEHRPDPTPEPEPGPEPVPRGPRQLIVVWESGSQSPAVAAAAKSAELKTYLSSNGHHLWLVDKDVKDASGETAPEAFATWIALAETRSLALPALFINAAGADGSKSDVLYAGDPPAAADGWIELLKKHGG